MARQEPCPPLLLCVVVQLQRETRAELLFSNNGVAIYSLGTKLGESAAVKVNFEKYPRGGDDGEKKSCVKSRKDGDADDATMVRSKRKNRTNES